MINGTRLNERIEKLATIGKDENGGVSRFSYTGTEKEANELVQQWMEEAGLTVQEDAVGNIIGSLEGTEDLPVIVLGSHIDTVPNGGKYDGALGVLTAIEVAHSLKDHGKRLKHPIKIISFKDEEGTRFGFGMIGSRAIAGTLTENDLEHEDDNGVTIKQAIQNFGLEERPLSTAVLENIKLYLEVHIEQGKILESNEVSVGNVTGIAGPLWLQFTLKGLAEHAGTTPMNQRQDALAGASVIISEIENIAKQTDSTVATVGKLSVKPNGVNVIPEEVQWTVDLRDINEAKRDAVEKNIRQFANREAQKRNLDLTITELQRIAPVPCDETIQQVIKESIDEISQRKIISLPSGAGHDAMQFRNVAPVGMIFVRSKDGISHNPKEFSSESDIEESGRVLYSTLLKVDQQ